MQPLLLTMGDPTGIGPELLVKALLEGHFSTLRQDLQIVGDIGILKQAATIFRVTATAEQRNDRCYLLRCGDRQITVHSLSCIDPAQIRYGHPDHACGKAMVDYIEFAVAECLGGRAAGIVTAPINKAAINAAGYHFPGHTELLAERCGTQKVVMMLAGPRLRVCLVTTHLAYAEVPAALSQQEIFETIRITADSLAMQFGIARPRLAVLALNPHAGENGLFGDEEERLIEPAIAAAQAAGIDADGPHSADTLFHFAARGDYDAVVCMYHDQGLIPLKLLHFEDAVNVTLGLPIVRTSVDHGTAYNLAGTGSANIASLIAALGMAGRMAVNMTAPRH